VPAAAAAASERPKLIYRAERNPALGQSQFTARWRQHARLGMSQPRWSNIHRYAHCDPIEEPPQSAGSCSGIALIWYRSEAHRLRHVADPAARAIMQADEADTFARPVREFSILVREIVRAPQSDAAARCFVFLRRAPRISRDAFQAHIAEDWGARRLRELSQLSGFSGYVQNLALPDMEAQGFGLAFDAIEEISCTAPCALPALDDDTVLASETIWTREVVLYAAQ
jgi:hypothetical protein